MIDEGFPKKILDALRHLQLLFVGVPLEEVFPLVKLLLAAAA